MILRLKLIVFCLLLISGPAFAADVSLVWDVSAGAAGYKLYQSIDSGATWDAGQDVGNVQSYTINGVPDSGLILFRVSAYNAIGETISKQSQYLPLSLRKWLDWW